MLKTQSDRLRHFIANAPTSMEEVAECIALALERVSEIANEYGDRCDEIPIQLEGELCLLDELVAASMQLTEKSMTAQLSKFCEQMLVAALEADAARQNSTFGSLARAAGQTLH